MGRHFPQINLIDSDSNQIILDTSILKAKFILVDFWFSHCTPCLRQFPELKNIVSEYKPTEFEIIGVSTDDKEDEDNWKLVMRKQKLNWKNYLDVNGIEAANRLNIFRYPTNFLLNNKGEIVQKAIPPFELQKFLTQNLR